METLIDEAGIDNGSPPDDSAAPSSSAGSNAAESESTDSPTPARVETKVDKDQEAFDRLGNGETPQNIRQNPRPAAPSTTRDDHGKQRGSAESKVTREPAAARTQEQGTYEGIDAKAVDALRRAQLLPPTDAWAEMGPKTRASLVAAAKRTLAAQGRLGQQIGQQRQQPAQPANEEPLDQAAEGADENAAEEPPAQPAAPPRGQRGVRAEAQPGATAAPQPATLKDALKPMTDYFGDEVAAPILSLFERQREQQLEQQQALAQMQEAHTQQQQALMQQVYGPQERAAWKTIEEGLPDQRKLTQPEKRLINQQATILFNASAGSGEEPLSWQQACEISGRSILQTDTQQAAQAALLSRRNNSLKSSPARGNSNSPAIRALTQDDKDARAFELLGAGRSVAEVKQAIQ